MMENDALDLPAIADATRYEILVDDTKRKPYSFRLETDDAGIVFRSKDYRTKAAAASVAARMLTANSAGKGDGR